MATSPSDIITTPSPTEELTFSQLEAYCSDNGRPLPADFADAWGFRREGRWSYLGFLFSDQCDVLLTLARFSGFDNAIAVDTREFGRQCLAKAANDLLNALFDENVIRNNGMGRGLNTQIDLGALTSGVYFAVVGNDWLLGKSPTFELYCDRLDLRAFGDAAASFTAPEGEPLRASEGPFPELAAVFRELAVLGDSGVDLGAVVDAYGAESVVFGPFSATVSLPLALNTLYSGKYSQPTINKPDSLANAVGASEMSVSEMMRMMDEVFYEKFEENYLAPALERGLLEPVGEGEGRAQRYRRTDL